MEIIILSGGLGNQMFQYAFYLQRNATHKHKVFLDNYSVGRENTHNGLEIARLFNITYENMPFPVRVLSRLIRKIRIYIITGKLPQSARIIFLIIKYIGIHVIEEKHDGVFNSTYLAEKKGVSFFFGYWQTEKYFISIKEKICKQFSFPMDEISEKTRRLVEIIKKTESISIHIRRGDYLSPEYYQTHGTVCSNEYYKKSISYILEHRKSPSFFVFSDDIEWVMTNLNIPGEVFYVDWNTQVDSWQDMFLMSQCKDNIIANSSFSWWAAWLNNNTEKIVISPSNFLADKETIDTVPQNWIRL